MKAKKSVRLGDFQMLFEICKEEYISWIELQKVIQDLESCGKDNKSVRIGKYPVPIVGFKYGAEINNARFALSKSYSKTIIFLAIYLEAYIFDYAASRLGNAYVKKYLEKLDVLSKWKIIPNLVTGDEIDSKSHKYGYLKKIIAARNELVHNKSQDISAILQNTKEKKKELNLKLCFECLEYLLTEINRLDPGFTSLVNNLDELRDLINTT